jgi:nucleoside-diphosphate-sugar epimerase
MTDAIRCTQIMCDVRPDVIINLAMAYHTLGSTSNRDIAEVNYHGTVELIKAFQQSGGRRFITAGTCFEYGHQTAPRISETAPCHPIYDYAQAKARATAAILDRDNLRGLEAIVLRIFAPYGPREDGQRIVPQLLRAAILGERLNLSPGEQIRDYVYVADVAAAFVTAALHPRLPKARAVYNVCTGVGHSLKKLAAVVGTTLSQPLDLAWGAVPYRPDEMMRLVGDNRRIGDDLGWQPRLDLSQGLLQYAEWWIQQQSRRVNAA